MLKFIYYVFNILKNCFVVKSVFQNCKNIQLYSKKALTETLQLTVAWLDELVGKMSLPIAIPNKLDRSKDQNKIKSSGNIFPLLLFLQVSVW
jgi:hypothetical protein